MGTTKQRNDLTFVQCFLFVCLFVIFYAGGIINFLILSQVGVSSWFHYLYNLSYSSFSTHIPLTFDTYSVIAKFDTWKLVTKAHLKIIQWTYNQWILTYRNIPKISLGAYLFQRPFLRGLFLERLIFGRAYFMEGNLSFKIDWASLIVGSKLTVFALF